MTHLTYLVAVIAPVLIASIYFSGLCFNGRRSILEFPVAHRRRCEIKASNGTWPIFSVNPYEDSGYCKEEMDVCPSIFLPLTRIWTEIQSRHPTNMSMFLVNIGANNGINADPMFPIIKGNPSIGGVLIEYDRHLFQQLRNNMQEYPNLQLVNDGISPENAVSLCKGKKIGDAPNPSPHASLDILKLDIDGCECHILAVLMQDSFYLAKVIQIELNHHIPPPISYKDMCANGSSGRASSSLDVWGCSMQAAYDVLAPYGYSLLQYDWPDAVFVHKDYIQMFACVTGDVATSLSRNYWIGYYHAKDNYKRFPMHQHNKEFVSRLPELALRSFLQPVEAINHIISNYSSTWSKRPLWIELAVAGTDVGVSVVSNETGVNFLWH